MTSPIGGLPVLTSVAEGSTGTSAICCGRLDHESNSITCSTGAAKQQRQQRRVYFVEERNIVHEFQPVDLSDLALVTALWQQPAEMYNCKQALKSSARQWRSTGLGMLLADTFHSTGDLKGKANNSINDGSDRNSNSNVKQRMNPRLCQKQLNTFAQLPDEFYNRGIERYLSRKHDHERTMCKRSIIQEIVFQSEQLRRQQQKQKRSVAQKGEESSTTQQEQQHQAEYLARFAQQLNRDAAIFARRCGRADELAVRRGAAENLDAAYRLVDYLIELYHEQQQQNGGMAVMPTHERPAHQKQPPPASVNKTVSSVLVDGSRIKSPPTSVTPSQQQQQSKTSATTKVVGRRVEMLQARKA